MGNVIVCVLCVIHNRTLFAWAINSSSWMNQTEKRKLWNKRMNELDNFTWKTIWIRIMCFGTDNWLVQCSGSTFLRINMMLTQSSFLSKTSANILANSFLSEMLKMPLTEISLIVNFSSITYFGSRWYQLNFALKIFKPPPSFGILFRKQTAQYPSCCFWTSYSWKKKSLWWPLESDWLCKHALSNSKVFAYYKWFCPLFGGIKCSIIILGMV